MHQIQITNLAVTFSLSQVIRTAFTVDLPMNQHPPHLHTNAIVRHLRLAPASGAAAWALRYRTHFGPPITVLMQTTPASSTVTFTCLLPLAPTSTVLFA